MFVIQGMEIPLSISSKIVMPAKAGIQNGRTPPFQRMDSRFRGNDETMGGKMCERRSACAGVTTRVFQLDWIML